MNGATNGQPAPSPAAAWAVVALLVVLGVVAYLDRQVISLLVEPIKRDLAISDTQIGLLQGFAFALLYTTCAIPIGYAVDRYSRRLIIFTGVLIWGLAASLSGLATTFGWLLLARMFVGMGEAALAPASYSILSDLFDRTRLSLVLSIYSIGSTIGSASALVITAVLIDQVGDGIVLPGVGLLRPWQAVLFMTGLPGLVLCFLVFAIPEPRRTSATAPDGIDPHNGWRALGRFVRGHRAFFVCHFTAFACLLATAYASLSWLPAILQRQFGWAIRDIGWTLGLVSAIAGIAGLLVNGWAADRLFARGERAAHLVYYAGAAALIGLLGTAAAFMPSGGLYLVMMVPVIMLNGFAGVSAAALQIVTPPSLRGKVSALCLMVVGLFGLVVGPMAVGLLADHVVGPQRLALALALVYATLMPVAVVCCLRGIAPMRIAVAASS